MAATTTTERRKCPACQGEAVQEESPAYGKGFVRLRCLSASCGNATQSFKPAKPRKARRPQQERRSPGTRTREAGGDLGTWGADAHWRDADEREAD